MSESLRYASLKLHACPSNNNLKYQEKRDHLYHLGLTSEDNLEERFGDVKFVCVGGKPNRMRAFAKLMYEKLNHPKNSEFEEHDTDSFHGNCLGRLKNISESAGRYAMFKVGPVLSASHGIGIPSTSILFNEIIKLLQYAECTDVTFFRLGTSGGLGLKPGTVTVTHQAYDGLLEPGFKQIVCGKLKTFDSTCDEDFTKEICDCAKAVDIKAVVGNTMSCNDFYEEQARLDGAFCDYTNKDKMEFLKRAHHQCGVINIEMEAACCIALCKRADIKCGVVCVTIVNRLDGDSVTEDVALLKEWEKYPQKTVAEYIKRHIASTLPGSSANDNDANK